MPADALRETRLHADEIKFLLPAALGPTVREWARRHLRPDPHGRGPFQDEYDTATVYFDTVSRDVFHRRGSFGRCKYRIRRYDAAPVVFLERKLRRPGLLTKRRTAIDIDAAACAASGESTLTGLSAGAPTNASGDWFRQRVLLRGLRPACEVRYRRLARIELSAHGPARLTLDEALVTSRSRGGLFDSAAECSHVLDGHVILEMKFRRDIPGIFKQLIAELRLQPQPISKYRLAMQLLEPVTAGGDGDAASGSMSPAPGGASEADRSCA